MYYVAIRNNWSDYVDYVRCETWNDAVDNLRELFFESAEDCDRIDEDTWLKETAAKITVGWRVTLINIVEFEERSSIEQNPENGDFDIYMLSLSEDDASTEADWT